MIGGAALIFFSIAVPDVIAPFAHGIPKGGEYETAWVFPRALYGLVVSSMLGVVVTFLTKPRTEEQMAGLVWSSIGDALAHYKGRSGAERPGKPRLVKAVGGLALEQADNDMPLCQLSKPLMKALEVEVGDVVYVCDPRRWLGGLRSEHCIVGAASDEDGEAVRLPDSILADITHKSDQVRIERIV